VASANQWPDHRYRETPNRRLHKIPDTTGSSLAPVVSAIRKSDLLASISLLLVRKSDLLASKSHFLVADELASFSDNLSTFLKIFTKHRKNERGFPSLADPGISGPE